ncbi:MAG: YfcE family phosphodiesterase [Dehalococcoidia bacterium]|nr:YfcE family phosphodiesterase [Dehalococcoidia bacterium]
MTADPTHPTRRWIDRHSFTGDMLFGLVSDTHIPEARAAIFDEVYAAFRGVDLILHAGDMHDIVVLDWLQEVAPVLGVRGNGDDGSSGRPVAPDDDPRLPYNQLLDVDGLLIGMTHDFPHEPYVGADLNHRMERHFEGRVDVVVAGDTHVPVVAHWEDVLVVNSGSPMFPRNLQTQLGTIGFLEVRGGAVVDAWIEQLH